MGNISKNEFSRNLAPFIQVARVFNRIAWPHFRVLESMVLLILNTYQTLHLPCCLHIFLPEAKGQICLVLKVTLLHFHHVAIS